MKIGSPQFTYDLSISIITGIVVSLINLLVLKRLVQRKYYRRFLMWMIALAVIVAALVWTVGLDKIRRYF
jgi:undecaprenyl pyrophosphate phosphatase UppP